ncbi:MAG: sulfur carrier protein ThiS [Phycisphaera sp.]|nr:sulfur carrier protein ThiS [Phycisphaera sp.]
MNLTVNGQPRSSEKSHTVRDLVIEMGLAKAAVAVEVNKQLVPRKRHETTILNDNDVVEIVTLVGGG